MLTGNYQPDNSRISEFHRRNLEALKDLFVQILRLCQKAGMVRAETEAAAARRRQQEAEEAKAKASAARESDAAAEGR